MLRRIISTHLPRQQLPFRNVSASASPVAALREPKKFYKAVSVIQSGKNVNEFEISLDKRRLKTPMGNILAIPSEGLALAVAHEWNSQKKTIKRESMTLTNICNTVIDNPRKLDPSSIIDSCMNFLATDTLCYRTDEPVEAKYQAEKWDPVLKNVEDRFHIKLSTTTGLIALDIPQSVSDTLRAYFATLPHSALFAVQLAVETSKSLILALAVLTKLVSVNEAAHLARLEQNYQINKWGNVEWHHDIEHHDLVAQLAAAVLYFHYATETHTVVKKN